MYKSNAPWGTPKSINTKIKKETCVLLFKTKIESMRNKKNANNIK